MSTIEENGIKFSKELKIIGQKYSGYFNSVTSKPENIDDCFMIKNYSTIYYRKRYELREDILQEVLSKFREIFKEDAVIHSTEL